MTTDTKQLTAGVVGGLVGGVLFGVMMQMMGMLGMVAGLVGQDGAAVGWVVHLAISILFGLGFALVIGPRSTSWVGRWVWVRSTASSCGWSARW